MVDKERLEKAIKASGIKGKSLAKKLGISYHTFSNKMNNLTEFKISEVLALEYELRLSEEDTRQIFFTRNVEFNSTLGRV